MPHSLIVDDDRNFSMGLSELVTREGFTTSTAYSLKEARSELSKAYPDVTLVDLNLPDGSGMDLLKDIESGGGGQGILINCGAVSPNLIETELFGHERGSFTGADRLHKGYFERADRGTLFLDEITEMPIELQVKLLRVLETSKITRIGGSQSLDVDVRVV